MLRERGANLAGGAVLVVGETFDDDADAAGAEALITDFLELFGARPAALIDGALDVVLRHVDGAAGRHGAEQARIGVRIGAAELYRRLDFTRDLGEYLRALLILSALAVLDVRKF